MNYVNQLSAVSFCTIEAEFQNAQPVGSLPAELVAK